MVMAMTDDSIVHEFFDNFSFGYLDSCSIPTLRIVNSGVMLSFVVRAVFSDNPALFLTSTRLTATSGRPFH
jgi:hypothetical protein